MGRLNYDSAPVRNIPTAAPGDSSSAPASTAFVQNAVPAGSVQAYAGPVPPAGWLLCDGSNVSRTTYAKLFAAIGTTWGVGDGSTTFKLPDLRGEFVRGLDQGRGVDTGRTLGSSQPASSVNARPDKGASNEIVVTGQNIEAGPSQGSAVWPSTSTTAPAQSISSFSVRPRNVAMNYIIKFA